SPLFPYTTLFRSKPADGVHQVRPGIKREVARDARAQGQVGIPHAPPKRRAHGGGVNVVNVASRFPMGEPWTETKLSVTRTVQVSPGGRGCFRRSQISLCSGNCTKAFQTPSGCSTCRVHSRRGCTAPMQ